LASSCRMTMPAAATAACACALSSTTRFPYFASSCRLRPSPLCAACLQKLLPTSPPGRRRYIVQCAAVRARRV
jgi:hypothetical protein